MCQVLINVLYILMFYIFTMVVVVEERPPRMNVKHFGWTAIHNKALYKCIIHSFIQDFGKKSKVILKTNE